MPGRSSQSSARDAISIQRSHEYLRTHDAPDYWALSPFYEPQATGSACSVAAIAMLMNALIGLPAKGNETLVTQGSLLKAVDNAQWAAEAAQGGPGVTFEEVRTYVALSLKAYKLDAEVEVFRPADSPQASLARLRELLADNERSDADIVLVYYNQGVVTGDWDGPHLSPIGAYDGARVLIMDVDREFYVPYWTSAEKLLEAMLRPAPARHGPLAGETGGIVRVTINRAPNRTAQ